MSAHSKKLTKISQVKKKNKIQQIPSSNQQPLDPNGIIQPPEVRSEIDVSYSIKVEEESFQIVPKDSQNSVVENSRIAASQQTQTSDKQEDEPPTQNSPYFSNTKESENDEKLNAKLQEFLVPPLEQQQQSESLSPRQNEFEFQTNHIHKNISPKSDFRQSLQPSRNVRMHIDHQKKNSHCDNNFDKVYGSVERSPPQKVNFLESPKTPQTLIISNSKTLNGNQKFISPYEQRKKPNYVEYIKSGVNKTPKTQNELSKSPYYYDKYQLKEDIYRYDESKLSIEEQLYLKEEQIYKYKQELQRLEIEACHLRKLKYKKTLMHS